MNSVTCLVTGATDGIGKATALRLAEFGFDVVLHGRNTDKLRAVANEIERCSGKTPDMYVADFSRLNDVANFAHQLLEKHSDLSVLINNAGVLTDHRQESADGFELTFAVNYLAPVLLTTILLPVLRANSPARVVNVASSAMGGGDINFSDLQFEQGFDGWQAYANSKLANVLFSNVLAEQLQDSGVVSNALCPGLIDTNFFHTNSVFANGMYERMKPGMRPPEQGADIPFYLATDGATGMANGKFYLRRPDLDLGDQIRSLPINWDRDTAQQLWDETQSLLVPWRK